MRKYIAHSADATKGIKEQTYHDHVVGVHTRCQQTIQYLRQYCSSEFIDFLEMTVLPAAIWHDCGKLCDYSQQILKGEVDGKVHKMPNHVDAGTKVLRDEGNDIASYLVFAHHLGFKVEIVGDFRDRANLNLRCPWVPKSDLPMANYTDIHIDTLKSRQAECVNIEYKSWDESIDYRKINASWIRAALSVLVDADHYDTARNYGEFVDDEYIQVKTELRRKNLLSYTNKFKQDKDKSIRNQNRDLVFKDSWSFGSNMKKFAHLSSEVGNGKTLALLAAAINTNPSKIIYASPFIVITSQVYEQAKAAFIKSGEKGWNKVMRLHTHTNKHANEADPALARRYTKSWNAEMIFTTIVQLVHTLLGFHPGSLKKYYNFAGSTIVIDEYQSIPPKLLRILLFQLEFLVDHMNCKVLLVSGTLIKFWENKKFYLFDRKGHEFKYKDMVESVISEIVAAQTLALEQKRVQIRYCPPDELVNTLYTKQRICQEIIEKSKLGSVLVVCNTKLNAAAIAWCLKSKLSNDSVYHLSTSLTHNDRKRISDTVEERLKNKLPCILVATSCVSSGWDVSFKNGFAENCGHNNIMQIAGRINRENEFNDSVLQVFRLDRNAGFNHHPVFVDPARIFDDMYREDMYGPEFCNKAFEFEVKDLNNIGKLMDKKVSLAQLMQYEYDKNFPIVGDLARVIAEETIPVIIKKLLPDNFDYKIDDSTEYSIQLYETQLNELIRQNLVEAFDEDVYHYVGEYDEYFLGYLAHMKNELEAIL